MVDRDGLVLRTVPLSVVYAAYQATCVVRYSVLRTIREQVGRYFMGKCGWLTAWQKKQGSNPCCSQLFARCSLAALAIRSNSSPLVLRTQALLGLEPQ